jgi:nuclear receptor co-repressor 1
VIVTGGGGGGGATGGGTSTGGGGAPAAGGGPVGGGTAAVEGIGRGIGKIPCGAAPMIEPTTVPWASQSDRPSSPMM